MTYFNPDVYNIDNMTDSDRKEIEFWKDLFDSAIENALGCVKPYEDDSILDKIKCEIASEFCKQLREELENEMLCLML